MFVVKEKLKSVEAWWFCGVFLVRINNLFKKCFLRSALILGFLCSAGLKFENVFLKLFQSIMGQMGCEGFFHNY